MRSFAYVVLATAALAGCAESVAPSFPANAGRDAAIDPDGAGGQGGSNGGGGEGGGGEGGRGFVGPWCEMKTFCTACPRLDTLCDGDCPLRGEVCISTGCQDCDSGVCVELSSCQVTGAGACEKDDDCGDPAYICDCGDPEIAICEGRTGRCLRPDGGCDDSSDCVAGFACENSECVDRRVPCESGLDCPHGFACLFDSPYQRFCRRITRPCGVDRDCSALGVPCGDADEDGRRECMPSLMPNASAPVSCDKTQCSDDPAGPVCETTVGGLSAVCGRFGLCESDDDCCKSVDDCDQDDPKFECRDLWGDGRKECVLPGGSCDDSSQCPLRTLCASLRAGDPPACVGGAAM